MSIVASQGLLKHSLLGFSSSYMITYFGGKTLICWCCTIIGYWEFCFQSLLTVPGGRSLWHSSLMYFLYRSHPLILFPWNFSFVSCNSSSFFHYWLILLFSEVCLSHDFYSSPLPYVHFSHIVKRKSVLSFRHWFIWVDPFLDRRLRRQLTGGWSTCYGQLC